MSSIDIEAHKAAYTAGDTSAKISVSGSPEFLAWFELVARDYPCMLAELEGLRKSRDVLRKELRRVRRHKSVDNGENMITDEQLAAELIERLNRLCEDAEVKALLEVFIEDPTKRVSVSQALADHPTIQVSTTVGAFPTVSLLGVFNGLVGVIPEGPKKDWGYIAACFDDKGELLRFESVTSENIKCLT